MKDGLDYRAIGLRVRGLRQQQELTQESLAELVGVSPSFVGHIERGEKKASLETDRKSTRLNSSHPTTSRMPSSA